MHLKAKHYLAGLAVLAMSIPAWAHTYKEPLDISKGTSVGSTKLNPGSYELSADDTTQSLNILQKGKVIATVPGQWVKLPQKAEAPSTVSDGDKITQVQFGGSNQAFQLR